MNDPGLDDPIATEAKDVENQHNDEREERVEDEQAFLNPSRWWFASTAFPLIAGTFGPMASAFSICALVVHWREHIPSGVTEEDGTLVPDPTWLIAINGTQLAIALISNLFLLMNMARRVRFSVAQPITIIGWYISSFALIGLCACANGPLKIEPWTEYALSGAYYYAIFSAGLYFLCASLMMCTVWGAYKKHYDKEFQLTMSQRTLMLQTISFLAYLLAGAAVFSHIEDWKYLDAVYWADFTLLTVGIGDFSPATHLGRSLLFPFAIGGIIILGLVIGSIRSLVLERGKVKMGARMVEKQRQQILKRLEKKNSGLLKPVDDSTMQRTSSFTERERRQKEFELMRKIQEAAHTKRRWTSLIISGTTWFLLWFVGAAIFQATEYKQDWTYFISLYYSYTSLLTIGYGDFYPRSNAGKAFFVLWSLLAVPSLTILISNMGDTVVKGIRDVTLWVGNFTVLPGDRGVKTELKRAVGTISFGRFFDEHVHEQPPGGIVGEGKLGRGTESEDDDVHEEAPTDASYKAEGDRSKVQSSQAKSKTKKEWKPKSKRHYHVTLIEEIGVVMKEVHASPPRKYSFDEWAWYLKLIGEDEASSETHRKAKIKPKADGEGLGAAMAKKEGEGEKVAEWSWVGNRSPLMGNKGEPQWILDALHKTLERELSDLRKMELEAGDGGDSGAGDVHTDRKGGFEGDGPGATKDGQQVRRRSAGTDPERSVGTREDGEASIKDSGDI